MATLVLDRTRILAHRRAVGAIDVRLPHGADSLRVAAWAGLQDSMPRAALFSIHARVSGTDATTWEHPSLVQVWGPRYSAFVVAAIDRAVFTLGRLPPTGRGRQRAEDTAARLCAFLGDRSMTYGEAGRALGVSPNSLRYATTTGTVVIRWDGARQPEIRCVPRPEVEPADATAELVRRYLHVFGPSTHDGFRKWAGVGAAHATSAFAAIEPELLPVRTPLGDAWILARDEGSFTGASTEPAAARLLPSGDAYWLLSGEERSLLVPDAARRPLLWTSRVWPGAVLVDGEIVGTWQRAQHKVTVDPWRTLDGRERAAVEAEASSLPVPGIDTAIEVTWTA